MISTETVDSILGADAMDASDDLIGEVSQVYLDAVTEQPTWASVRLGLLSTAEVLVPLDAAEWDERTLHVAVDRQVARSAPRMEADEPLTDHEEERLFAHYGIPSVRHARNPDEVYEVAAEDVCYSVHDEPAILATARA